MRNGEPEVISMDLEAIDRDCPCGLPLGAVYSRYRTVFRVWAPLAEHVRLHLYRDGTDAPAFDELTMQRQGRVWETIVEGDLAGIYYTYRIRTDGREQETPDLFGRACGVNGQRSMVLRASMTDPEGWEQSRPVHLASPADAVICELHVRDFSSDLSADFTHRGKFLAFTEHGVTNRAGDPVGLDHLAELGVTHIHLLPVMDFASLDERKSDPGFNWGYDPVQYFVPEGSYASDPFDGAVRIRELKALIQAAHSRNIGIILDVVYNHTFALEESPFSKTFPGYFYRHDANGYSNGSGCGNEIASERRMMRRIIIESLCWWAQEYRVDGFRFDLMGLLDTETLNLAERRLRTINPDILLYGEGWTGGLSPLDGSLRALKENARSVPGFAMFSDDLRDSVKGHVFDDRAQGYINGNAQGERARIRQALCGGVYHPDNAAKPEACWTDSPLQSVNYVEVHDNLTFRDKLTLSMPGASEERLFAADRMGAALVVLSQGIPLFQAGQEFFRSKPLPEGGFDHNSYRSPDCVNALKWDDLTKYRALSDFYRGLIAIRKRFPDFRMRTAEEIRERIRFTDLTDGALRVQIGDFVLFLDPGEQTLHVSVRGEVYADSERASDTPLYSVSGETEIPPHGLLLVRTES